MKQVYKNVYKTNLRCRVHEYNILLSSIRVMRTYLNTMDNIAMKEYK